MPYTDFIWYLVVLNRVLRKHIEDGIEFLRILEGLAGEKAILFTGNIDDDLGGVRLDTGELDLRNEREVIAYFATPPPDVIVFSTSMSPNASSSFRYR